MKFNIIFAALAFSVLPSSVFSQTIQPLSYDKTYANPNGSLDTVACSDGENSLIARGYTTFGSLPSFPNIGGAFDISGWNSPNCGACWQLTYTSAKGIKKSINVTAIDVSLFGFNIALPAMNTLTDGQAVALGRVNVDAVYVHPSSCGL